MHCLPRSLSVRLFLIVLAGVVSAIALTSSLHHHDRAKVFGEYRVHTAIDHLADAVLLLAALPPSSRASAAAALSRGRMAGRIRCARRTRLGRGSQGIFKTPQRTPRRCCASG